MPWTLYRYILWELLKILIVSTTVMVCVISFAAAIKPLSDGLLDPLRLLKFVMYVAPTFLTFIVPFCSAFASCVVFHRMTSENEIVACSASGLSYRAILLPVMTLGLMLTLFLFFMSNWVLPTFNRYSADLIREDITKLLVQKVKEGQPVALGNDVVLYADNAEVFDPTPQMLELEIPPQQVIVLEGVALARRDSQGQTRTDGTARRAEMSLYLVDGQTWIAGILKGVTMFDTSGATQSSVGGTDTEALLKPVNIPNSLEDDPAFLSWKELEALRKNPDRYDRVSRAKQRLAERLASERILRAMFRELMSTGNLVPVKLTDTMLNEQVILSSPQVQREQHRLILQGTAEQPIVILRYSENGTLKLRIETELAYVTVDPSSPLSEPTVHIRAMDARTIDTQQSRGRRPEHILEGLQWHQRVQVNLARTSAEELIAQVKAGAQMRRSRDLKSATEHLELVISKLRRHIEAQLHQRAALAVSCMLTLMLGAVLSMKLRGSMPLVVFFWTFLLTIVILIITYSGENVTTDTGKHIAMGISVIWSGAVILLGVLIASYFKLAKN